MNANNDQGGYPEASCDQNRDEKWLKNGNFDGYRKYIFFSQKCLENGSYGLISMRGCVFVFFTGVHKRPHWAPKNSELVNIAVVVVVVIVPLKLIGKNAKYGVLGACQSYVDFRSAIHDQLGCLEARNSLK